MEQTQIKGGTATSSKGSDSQPHLLNDHDCLLGRGSGPNSFKGNVMFRLLVLEAYRQHLSEQWLRLQIDPTARDTAQQQLFSGSSTNNRQSPLPVPNAATKNEIANHVVAVVKARKGRFLRKLSAGEEKQMKMQTVSLEGHNKGSATRSLCADTSCSPFLVQDPEGHTFYAVEVSDKDAKEKVKQTLRFMIDQRPRRELAKRAAKSSRQSGLSALLQGTSKNEETSAGMPLSAAGLRRPPELTLSNASPASFKDTLSPALLAMNPNATLSSPSLLGGNQPMLSSSDSNSSLPLQNALIALALQNARQREQGMNDDSTTNLLLQLLGNHSGTSNNTASNLLNNIRFNGNLSNGNFSSNTMDVLAAAARLREQEQLRSILNQAHRENIFQSNNTKSTDWNLFSGLAQK